MARFLFIVCLGLSIAHAQLPVAELHSINPPVVKAGETTEITLTGANLEDLGDLHFSISGPVGKRVNLPESEYRLYPVHNNRKYAVTIPADTKPQTAEVRVNSYFGISTSRPLVIAPSDAKLAKDSAGAAHHKLESAPILERETIAFGNTDSRSIDWWRFTAKKGERLVIHCQAEQIHSQADATLMLVDARGFELESNRDTVGRDPMIDFTAPADGEYRIGVHDFYYNGGVNFPYILQITEKPWIDAVFPPAGKAGETYTATVIGRNLPGGSLSEGYEINQKPVETRQVRIAVPEAAQEQRFHWDIPARAMLPDFPWQLENSNTVNVGFADLPVRAIDVDFDKRVEIPIEIASRFHESGDIDYYTFTAQKGKTYYAEVTGDRLAGAVDPSLIVDSVEGDSFKKYRDGDDTGDKAGAVFRDGSRDTVVSISAGDKDKDFRIGVINQFSDGGPDKIYRLAIREAKPDFEVLAVSERAQAEKRETWPAMPHLRKGGSFALRVLITRKDGFSDPITVSAKNLPEGVTCSPVTFAAKESTGRIVFSSTPDAAGWSGSVNIVASGKGIEHPIRIGNNLTGTNDYTSTRLRPVVNSHVPLSVSEHETCPATITLPKRSFSVEIGKKLEIPFQVARHAPKGNLAVTVDGLRGLQKPPTANVTEKAAEGKLVVDFTSKKGTFIPETGTWNFVLKGTGITRYQRNLEAVKRAEAEEKHVAELLKKNPSAQKEKAAADARVAAAKKAAAAKDLKFTVWSQPVSVTVTAPAKEKK